MRPNEEGTKKQVSWMQTTSVYTKGKKGPIRKDLMKTNPARDIKEKRD